MSQHSIQSFEKYCDKHSLRITPPRLSAFKIIHSAEKPMTAYEVLEEMAQDIKSPKPPTAYRAIDFLLENGFIHRIESLNAYIPCEEKHKHDGSQFMICDICNHVDEIHLCTLPATLQNRVDSENFTLNHWNVEIHGVCVKCSAKK
ncbi:MAG: transcriptional repressor [Zetaproteobacteria bacterium]|nr:MAG: transcriptional repressor [Zetaproteobacteria bacterium]